MEARELMKVISLNPEDWRLLPPNLARRPVVTQGNELRVPQVGQAAAPAFGWRPGRQGRPGRHERAAVKGPLRPAA
jgi:hypothetical protein